MNKKLPTVLFFGNEQIATGISSSAITIKSLVDASYNIQANVVHNTTNSRRNKLITDNITVAEQNSIPIIANPSDNDLLLFIQQNNPDIGVLIAYGKIIPQNIIDMFKFGIINIHPSLLPLHRGPTPIESVILQNSKSTGVSVMRLSAQMDAGPVIAQKEVALNGTESKKQIAESLLSLGSQLLLSCIPQLTAGKLIPTKQIENLATYDNKISKQDGIINPQKSADRLEREVRAYLGWPGSRLQVSNTWLTVTKASTSIISANIGTLTLKDGKLLYGCKGGSLIIEQIKPSGKKEMSASAFCNGYAHLLNK
ncbi:methionyl-tRNA formyltransferase [Candidatus Saccharibacteria bacterium]|nr:methionyl-tRNA formyltransferase [Candidatus Saccharibacteria bacterium]